MCCFPPLIPCLRAAGVLVSILLLQACSTMSANECRQANWHDVGLRDSMVGAPLTQLDRRTKDCADVGVTVQVPLYLGGRNEGLPSYCRLDNAVRLGLEGKTYHGVCAAGIPDVLQQGCFQGLFQRHKLQQAVALGTEFGAVLRRSVFIIQHRFQFG